MGGMRGPVGSCWRRRLAEHRQRDGWAFETGLALSSVVQASVLAVIARRRHRDASGAVTAASSDPVRIASPPDSADERAIRRRMVGRIDGPASGANLAASAFPARVRASGSRCRARAGGPARCRARTPSRTAGPASGSRAEPGSAAGRGRWSGSHSGSTTTSEAPARRRPVTLARGRSRRSRACRARPHPHADAPSQARRPHHARSGALAELLAEACIDAAASPRPPSGSSAPSEPEPTVLVSGRPDFPWAST
jgi:hypothetical protein